MLVSLQCIPRRKFPITCCARMDHIFWQLLIKKLFQFKAFFMLSELAIIREMFVAMITSTQKIDSKC
ncbi:hypothetical protein BpHYR1_049980 [Brachionus plicatilis]|uniref:Uncharacterized protein n=1 Tax=Brachionus plicatilis TaxID=10195 RepID=A0A3M7Q2H5_BRAPC|nr:hypothetical protein BpHYR1_049980 [Brachionus plicatilis]